MDCPEREPGMPHEFQPSVGWAEGEHRRCLFCGRKESVKTTDPAFDFIDY